jgi:ribonuclease HI
LKARAIDVFSDSEVVVRQMTGKYRCRSPRLYSLHWTCRKLIRALEFTITHVPRSRNAEANHLASSAARRGQDLADLPSVVDPVSSTLAAPAALHP